MAEKTTLFKAPLTLRNKQIVLKNTPVVLHLFKMEDSKETRAIEFTMFGKTFTVCLVRDVRDVRDDPQGTFEELIKALLDEEKALQMSPSDETTEDIAITL